MCLDKGNVKPGSLTYKQADSVEWEHLCVCIGIGLAELAGDLSQRSDNLQHSFEKQQKF